MAKRPFEEQHMNVSLQESVLALLCYSNRGGAVVATQVESNHFSAPYDALAGAVIRFRNRYRKHPSRLELRSLLERLPVNEEQVEDLRQYLARAVSYAKNVTPEYAATLVHRHAQELALKQSAQHILRTLQEQSSDDDAIDKAMSLIFDTLKVKSIVADKGTSFSDVSKVREAIIETDEDQENSYKIGIRPLDDIGLRIKPGTMLLYIGAKNTGKSWACVHVGSQGILQGARVLHITLEMSEKEVTKRYVQSFFGIANSDATFLYSELKQKSGYSGSWTTKEESPLMYFRGDGVQRKIITKVKRWSRRFSRLKIKEFSSGQCTIANIANYLDFLEYSEHWSPNIVIVDYPDLMKVNSRELRNEIGRTYVNLRGLAAERHFGLFCPTQGNRSALGLETLRSRHVAEDISKIMTADNVLVYSQTDAEKPHGLARLQLEHARTIPAGKVCLISQSYPIGQYIRKAYTMSADYRERRREAEEGGSRRRRFNEDEDEDTE